MTTPNRIMAQTSNGMAISIYHNSEVAMEKPIELLGLIATDGDAYKLSDPSSGFYTVVNKLDAERLASAEQDEEGKYVILKVQPMLSAKDIKKRVPFAI